MKSDIKGCSTCPAGQEQYEKYCSEVSGRELVQYDYRAGYDGELFATVATTLEKCRKRRDRWLIAKIGLRAEKEHGDIIFDKCKEAINKYRETNDLDLVELFDKKSSDFIDHIIYIMQSCL